MTTYSFTTAGFHSFIVPTTGTYDILAQGGAGGGSGGMGAFEEALFSLNAGSKLWIWVGSDGASGLNAYVGGGGGATFIEYSDNAQANANAWAMPVLIAGGGGGGGYYGQVGGDATFTILSGLANASNGQAGNTLATGATGGSGGAGGATAMGGGGGTGFSATGFSGLGGLPSKSGMGGSFTLSSGTGVYGADGGVYGGGGGGRNGGGGGGGFNGGGGGGGDNFGSTYGAGGGGGSYINSFGTFYNAGVSSTDSYVSITLTCYLPNTHILTTRGEVSVEDLKIGDLLPTLSGENIPIKWVGIQQFMGQFATRNASPVRFHVGALGNGLPKRDLYVSAGHSMKIGDHLVDARLLVNGVTITQHQSAEQLEYYHIDLGEHHCILAEGAWSESYLECNANRESFVNADEFYDSHRYHLTNSLVEKCLPHVADYQDPRHAALFHTLLAHIPADRVTTDADLHLLADGERLEPYEFMPHAFMFRIPAGTQVLRLLSHASKPCELGLPADDRQLGFCIQGLASQSEDGTVKITIKPDHAQLLEGFHPAEGTQHRWTRGDALLPDMLLGTSTEDMTLTIKGRALPRYHLTNYCDEVTAQGCLHS